MGHFVATVPFGMLKSARLKRMAGAWLIIPFTGVEIAALGTAVCMILRRAGDFERLVFSGDRILIEVRERGLARQFEFHRDWARLVTGETDSVRCVHTAGQWKSDVIAVQKVAVRWRLNGAAGWAATGFRADQSVI
jgi:uncharacterized membrane protein